MIPKPANGHTLFLQRQFSIQNSILLHRNHDFAHGLTGAEEFHGLVQLLEGEGVAYVGGADTQLGDFAQVLVHEVGPLEEVDEVEGHERAVGGGHLHGVDLGPGIPLPGSPEQVGAVAGILKTGGTKADHATHGGQAGEGVHHHLTALGFQGHIKLAVAQGLL